MARSRNNRDNVNESLAEALLRGIDFDIREQERAREDVAKGRSDGYMGPNGEVTVITGPFSSITYRPGGVTYSGI
jgi:hypothetical protein